MNISKPFVIFVESIIGSGKTTLIEKCLVPAFTEKGLKVVIVKEPVDEWGEILPLFYGDPTKYGYLFQTIAFHDRVRECQHKWRTHKDTADIFIAERSVQSDTFFMKTLYELGNISQIEMKAYEKWWNLWAEVNPLKPDLYIYLDPTMNAVMQRVSKRNRDGEEEVSLKYQTILKKYHDELFNAAYIVMDGRDVPTYKIETDDNFENDENVKSEIVSKVELKMKELNPAIICDRTGKICTGSSM
jgi:deoxyadenosine/deoxycytidine kinase